MSRLYMLDTKTVSDILKRNSPAARLRLTALNDSHFHKHFLYFYSLA